LRRHLLRVPGGDGIVATGSDIDAITVRARTRGRAFFPTPS
jgi:hypothetical protein